MNQIEEEPEEDLYTNKRKKGEPYFSPSLSHPYRRIDSFIPLHQNREEGWLPIVVAKTPKQVQMHLGKLCRPKMELVSLVFDMAKNEFTVCSLCLGMQHQQRLLELLWERNLSCEGQEYTLVVGLREWPGSKEQRHHYQLYSPTVSSDIQDLSTLSEEGLYTALAFYKTLLAIQRKQISIDQAFLNLTHENESIRILTKKAYEKETIDKTPQ